MELVDDQNNIETVIDFPITDVASEHFEFSEEQSDASATRRIESKVK